MGDFSVSLKAPGRNKHFRVHVENGMYCIGQRKFHSLDQLGKLKKNKQKLYFACRWNLNESMFLTYFLHKNVKRNLRREGSPQLFKEFLHSDLWCQNCKGNLSKRNVSPKTQYLPLTFLWNNFTDAANGRSKFTISWIRLSHSIISGATVKINLVDLLIFDKKFPTTWKSKSIKELPSFFRI